MISLMDSEIITILREIRDESKQTNLRLESMEGRVEFLDKRLSHGLESIKTSLVESIDVLTKQQTESELRLAFGVLSLADVTREVRDLLFGRLDDHRMVLEHEERLKSIENRIADRCTESAPIKINRHP